MSKVGKRAKNGQNQNKMVIYPQAEVLPTWCPLPPLSNGFPWSETSIRGRWTSLPQAFPPALAVVEVDRLLPGMRRAEMGGGRVPDWEEFDAEPRHSFGAAAKVAFGTHIFMGHTIFVGHTTVCLHSLAGTNPVF